MDSINDDLTEGNSMGSSSNTQKRKSRSAAWDVFDKLPLDKSGRQRAKCKRCGSKILADTQAGTSGLTRHLLSCPGAIIGDNEDLNRYPIVDHSSYRKHMACAVLRHNYPLSHVEHEETRKVHKFLNPTVRTISRNTLKADIWVIYNEEKERIKKELELVNGRICLTSDLWSSPTTDGYMSLTAHYVDSNWLLQKRILIFRHVPPPHNGQLLGEVLINFLQEWGIDQKIFTITLDNASYQDSMVKALSDHSFYHDSLLSEGRFLHVRCGAHVLNLIVQNGLKAIDESVIKIRESAKFVRSSQARKLKFADCCRMLGLNVNKKVRQDVPTRWNSTYLMLDSAMAYRAAFQKLQCVDNQYQCFPTSDEWVRVEKVASLLKPFHEITTLFSGVHYPTANLYFPNVFKIQGLIMKHLGSRDQIMKEMAEFMNEKFQKYWNCYSLIFSIAIILDPRYKLHYVQAVFSFLDTYTAAEKVNEVKDMLYSLFDQYMNYSDSDALLASQDMIERFGDEAIDDIDSAFEKHEKGHGYQEDKSQLDCYLDEAILPRNQKLNVLDHWKVNSVRWPELSLMAKDILSIPLTTVASESSFSCGGRILDKFRNSLLPKNVEALICTNDWLYGSLGHEDLGCEDVNEEEEGISTDIQSLVAQLGNDD